jgi:hypothetical protein
LENLPGIGAVGDQHYVAVNLTTAERMMREPVVPMPEGGAGSEDPEQARRLMDGWTKQVLQASRRERRRLLARNGNGNGKGA